MKNVSKRTKGAAEKLGGKIKKGVGRLIGNEQMQAEGRAEEIKGQVRTASAKATERGKGKVEEVTGAVKKNVGRVIDNEQMQVEGRAREIKGQVRQKVNR